MTTVKFVKLHPAAVAPKKATDGSAAYDLVATSRTDDMRDGYIYGTGLAFEIPAGYCIKLYPRSGLAIKNGVTLSNCVAVIDADYRGEVKIHLVPTDPIGGINFPHIGDRVAQMMVEKLVKTDFQEVDELGQTERGDGGFGSTGR